MRNKVFEKNEKRFSFPKKILKRTLEIYRKDYKTSKVKKTEIIDSIIISR